MTPLIADLGTPELLIILAVVILIFGSSKLPELARGSGRALRIFKAETKGLMDDDTPAAPDAPAAAASSVVAPAPVLNDLDRRQAELDRRRSELLAEQERLA